MLLRIRSPAGTARINVEPTTSGEDFAQLMLDGIPKSDEQPDPSTLKLSNQPGSSGESVPFSALVGRTVGDMGFSHGDLLFLSYKPISADPQSHPTTQASSSHPHPSQPDPSHPHTHTDPPLPNTIPLKDLSHVQEHDVDIYWYSQNGKIDRKRDPDFCRHGEKGMCDYCMPLEPYDAKYQATNQIKHLSYHAYLRKLLSSRPASQTAATDLPPLDPLSLSVMDPCPSGSHPPFPAGICSTCQPSAVTLQSQTYRMVDHIEFASPSIIDGILSAWRRTGTQRLAFLIGRQDKYDKVPMGVKTIVEAVWEPKQEGELDGLTVETPWEDEERVSEIASWCDKGLSIVGMIYTDLTPLPDDITKTLYKRHAQSYTASSLEMLLSAAYQISHPLPSKMSPTGHFSSRFVTCCLTGDADGGIGVLAWQASENAEAMVKAGIVEASVDPGIVRVRKPGEGEYIPEVFYSYKNEYGLQVKQPAKPTFPVEYLFVNITHGFPVDPSPLFLSTSFPTENRPGLHDQSLEMVISQLSGLLRGSDADISDTGTWPQRIKEEVKKWLSDWHLVAFLCMQGLFSLAEQKILCRAATMHAHPSDRNALEELFASGGWSTLLTIAESSSSASAPVQSNPPSRAFGEMGIDSPHTAGSSANISAMGDVEPSTGGAGGGESGAGGGGSGTGERICPHCTFVNEAGRSDCDICGLPLDG
ncbi:nuclear protein localization protein 4 [Kwoniella dejecticola CBS 10117]|uniref:Nuclear protein localization protein 4 n=1 Tax=Kwoniella dejecticola CBS 10117 TaxID=1296121 RepID=A0A1A6AH52_9TREE|nr:nuclear protein localization protein 4 [Kwoniella dejecticola CBS 10117]OBR89402.1 nuclear protein localization protein 4 [Kwoniella dejecticola CBS 10117]